jgi:hypothetical protein
MKRLALLLLIAAVAAAQENRMFARITVIAPREGLARQFEEGYKRHLDWHRDAGDRWTWYGWTVATGERLGWFIDGTFDHAAEDFDAAVEPAGDVADNEKNVVPFGRFVSSSFYRLRADLSRLPTERLDAPLATFTMVHVRPEKQAAFEKALASRDLLVFEQLAGGPHPSYLLIAPADKISQVVMSRVLAAGDSYESATSEMVRFRRELTYIPAPR